MAKRILTDEERAKNRKAAKMKYRDNPDNKIKIAFQRKLHRDDPEVKEKRKSYNKEYGSKPEVKLKKSEKAKSSEEKAKRKVYAKKYLSDPVVKEERKEYTKKYLSVEENKKKRSETVKAYDNRPEIKKKRKERSNTPEAKAKRKAYASDPKNKEIVNKAKRKYKSKPEAKVKASIANKKRLESDIQFKIAKNGRSRRWNVLNKQSTKKPMSYNESLGCTVEFFKQYLESLFKEGMTWDNYGHSKDKWHLDEIKPCAAFDLSDPEEYKACFHYTNCQPLWSNENSSKGSLYEGKRHKHKDKNTHNKQ